MTDLTASDKLDLLARVEQLEDEVERLKRIVEKLVRNGFVAGGGESNVRNHA